MKFTQTKTKPVYFSESTVTGNIHPYSIGSCTASDGQKYNYVMNNSSSNCNINPIYYC